MCETPRKIVSIFDRRRPKCHVADNCCAHARQKYVTDETREKIRTDGHAVQIIRVTDTTSERLI